MQAGGRELKYIPNYWKRTCKQNRLFPFVHYWRIQDENRFWNKSELAAVLDLVDAADRKLAMSILNDTFLANDILLVEDGALADGGADERAGRGRPSQAGTHGRRAAARRLAEHCQRSDGH